MSYNIQVKLSTGAYKVYIKTFNNEGHFDNWLSFIAKRGIKVIGITKIQKQLKTQFQFHNTKGATQVKEH